MASFSLSRWFPCPVGVTSCLASFSQFFTFLVGSLFFRMLWRIALLRWYWVMTCPGSTHSHKPLWLSFFALLRILYFLFSEEVESPALSLEAIMIHKVIHFIARQATKGHMVVLASTVGRCCYKESVQNTEASVGQVGAVRLTLACFRQYELQIRLCRVVEKFKLGLNWIKLAKLIAWVCVQVGLLLS